MNIADRKEFAVKEQRLRAFLDAQGYDAVLIGTTANFSWLSCGGKNKVVLNSDFGCCLLLVTRERKFCIANTMDARRLEEQELAGLGFEMVALKWHQESLVQRALFMVRGQKVLSDMPLKGAEHNFQRFYELHYPLTDQEISRYRQVGRDAEEVLRAVADQVRPGLTGNEVESMLLSEYARKKLNVACLILGSDEEMWNYRHPMPSPKRIDRQLMLVLAVERHGLNVPITRMVSFANDIPEETCRRYDAVCGIAARTIAACRPGARFAEILSMQKGWYAEMGFAEETENHFMGGITGYIPNDSSLCLDANAVVRERQAFNWFITITGVNIEDTMITIEQGNEILTRTGHWPLKSFPVQGGTIEVPQILMI
jgi:Xaa-Pro dipeptidase